MWASGRALERAAPAKVFSLAREYTHKREHEHEQAHEHTRARATKRSLHTFAVRTLTRFSTALPFFCSAATTCGLTASDPVATTISRNPCAYLRQARS